MNDMDIEVKEAIRIADLHLAGESPERRKALAKDIASAITRLSGQIAEELILDATQRMRKRH